MRFFILLLVPALLHAAVDERFGFVGTGGKEFSGKFHLPYYTLEGNYPTTGSVFSSVDPNNDPAAGHKVVREVAKLNVRNDALGQTNAEFQTAFQAYVQSLATWYLIPFGTKPTFTWYSPNGAALAAAESLQIVTTIRREKTRSPAVTGTVWEISNEPNLFPAILPGEYAAIFSNYYRIIKNEDPNAKVAFGSIFLRETAEDLKPKMLEVLHQMLIDGGALSLLGQTRFNNLEIDVQNTLFARIFNLGTVEYVNQTFAALTTNVRPDYITLHVYPYDDRTPTLTRANIQTKVDSLVTAIGVTLTSRGFTAPVWITEFGNINSSLTEATVVTAVSDMIDIFQANSGIGGWFYYKATGADQQVAILPGMSPALTRLAVDSAFSPVDSNFSCSALNSIGQMYHLRATGATCGAATVPSAPTAVTGVSGNAQVTVSWTVPGSTGGSPITGYTATAVQDTSRHCSTTTAVTCAVTGLTNGTAYTFTVTASNAVGKSAASAASAAITPQTTPGAPTAVTGVSGNAQVMVSWTAPGSTGGSPITGYTATAVQDTSRHCSTTTAVTCAVTGLTNGTAYTFTVTASNAVGKSAASAASAAITPQSPPDPPTAVTGVSGNAQVVVFWTAPGSSGGSPITGYRAIAVQDTNRFCTTTTALVCTVTALTNGTSYTFTVKATNVIGNSAASSPSAAIVPRGPPNPPTTIVATAGNAQVMISWVAPAFNGGSAITGYTARAVQDTNRTCTTTTALTCTVTGLTNGTSYTFNVTASNAIGKSANSSNSNAAIPRTVPDAPTGLTVIPGNAQVVLSWAAPSATGGSAITGYTATAVEDTSRHCATTTALTCAVIGLTNGTSYTFTVMARNTVGSGLPSAVSAAVIPRTVPGAPTAVIRMTGNARVTVGWTEPASDGGSPILGYTATAVEDTSKHCAATDTITTCVVTDLTNGSSYTFIVVATNAAGNSLPSAPSIVVIPATVPGAPTAVVAAATSGQATVSWVAPASNGGSAIIAYTVTALQDGKSCSTFGGTACVVTGLTNTVSYTFVVSASNIVGTGAASLPSSSVTGLRPRPPRSLNAMANGSPLIDILGRIFRNKTVDATAP